MSRLREKDVELCKHCGWQIYQIPFTEKSKLWYDMVHHEFHCLNNPHINLHEPKKDRRSGPHIP